MKIHSILMAAVFLSVTFATWAGPVVNKYFPMNNGDFRTYHDGSDTATEYFTQTTYNGHSVFSFNFHDEWDGYPFAKDTWYLGNNGGALALYGITTAWGSLTFNSPANMFTDQTLTNNKSLTSTVTGVYYAAGLGNVTFDITVQTTVSSIPGTITVPAGTFANCKLVEVVETATGYGIFQQAYDSAAWVVAPGVGVILDGVAEWDVDTGQFTTENGFGGSVDYLELVSGKINNVPIDYVPPSNVLSSWPPNGTQLYINPLYIWGIASDAGLGGSGIAQVTVNGSATSNDTVAGSGSAVWSTYTYLVPGTNTLKIVATDGAGNSTTNYLKVVEMLPAPMLMKQPTNQVVAPGANISFSVIPASSVLSLSYQWRKDGTALSGATNSNYSITGVQTNQAGNYCVVVTNASGSITSSNAYLFVDGQKPTITITNPAANARLSNAVAQVSGKATDNGQVEKIFYKLKAGSWLPASGTSNWQASVALIPGTNTFYAYSVDWVGNISATNSENIIYVVTALATVYTNGNGTISPNFNGQLLEVGKNYSMKAISAAGYGFVNWTGSVNTNSATVYFTMQSNLMLTANFMDVTKPVLTITSPTSKQSWSNQVFTIQGKTSDNVAVMNVFYQLNTNGWHQPTPINNWSNWQATVTLNPGPNILQAYAVDAAGNLSITSSVSFAYILSDILHVQIMGKGTLSPNYSNAVLQIGKTFSMTANPASGFAFTNWTGSVKGATVLNTNKAALSFLMQSNLVLTATFVDVAKPVLTITNLVAGQRVFNGDFTVKGKTSDNVQVANVWLQLNDGIWTNAITGNQWTNWSADLNLVPGTNKLAVYAMDTAGNCSITNCRSFQFVVTNVLGVQTVGRGTLSQKYSNSWLEIGRNYSITAKAVTGFVFTNWTISTNWIGGVTTNKATVQFIMASNLTLQATFTDAAKPVLSITNLAANQHVTNAMFTVKGNASDNVQVAFVLLKLNDGVWTNAVTFNQGTNWSADLNLIPGTNKLVIYAVDTTGNCSITNNRSFQFIAPQASVLANVALAIVSPNTSVANTNIFAITDWAYSTNGFSLTLQSSRNLNGRIQVSTDLTSWNTLTNFVGTNSSIIFRDSTATNSPNRFYRAVIP
jgi:hypothetical protein